MPYGITSTPLTYDPPLEPTATCLPFTTPPRGTTSSPLGYQQTQPPRQLRNLTAIPVLVITAEASYHTTYDHQTVHFLRTAGVPAEHARLAELDIHGNGHLLAIEANNHEIAALAARWLETSSVTKPVVPTPPHP